ncbi:MAG: type I restriction enzyme HsdR N-terminal domain-containing protein [Bacteroidaceae bacterium]|nr:type I restriction enzyme HsdR N-terminal domain-containing protein [Bacteroidaceae bacterium]
MSPQLPTLNLPPADLRTRTEDGRMRILDPLRHTFVALTPEEWVRQNFVSFLHHHKGYPLALMVNEVSISMAGMSRRCDTVVYDRSLRPLMIVEYKRPNVKITQRVFEQISRYNHAMHVDYLVVSNGMQHYCCRMDYDTTSYTFLNDIPTWQCL